MMKTKLIYVPSLSHVTLFAVRDFEETDFARALLV